MSNLKHCDVCGKAIQKPTKKELIQLAKDFISKMILNSLNDGTFLKPLKFYGIDENNFAHHLNLIQPYIDVLEEKIKKG